jgi:multiple sugar transport system substrate-binding protein
MKLFGRKVLVFMLVFALAFVTVACSSGSNGNNSGEGNSANDGGSTDKKKDPVTLRLLSHYVAANEEFLTPYIDQWNSENPDIQVKLEGVEFSELLPTIMTKQTSGQGADIMHIYSLWAGQLDKSGVIADPPEYIVEDVEANYPDSAVKGASVNGEIYGYPTEVQAFVMYYNKQLLKDKGYENPPATWDELLDMANAIETKDDSGNTKLQGFGFIRAWPAIVYHPFVALMATAGGEFIKDGKVNLDSDAAKQTMGLYEKIYGENGITDIGIDVMKSFGVSQTAIAINAGWWAGSLKATMGDDYQNVGVAPIPSPDGNTKGSVAYTWAWSVNKKSKHQEEAWKFLEWFNSQPIKDGMTPEGNFLLEAFNTISTRVSDTEAEPVKAKFENDPNMKIISETLQYATPETNAAAGAEIQDILFKQIDSVWTGQKTGEEALKSAQQDIQNKLGN